MTRITRIAHLALPLFITAGCSATPTPSMPTPSMPTPTPSMPTNTAPRHGSVLVVPPGPEAPPPPVEPAPEPDPAPPPTVEKRFRLTPASVVIQEKGNAVLELINSTDATHRYHHPGGSSGCAEFTWKVLLIAEDGTTYDRDPDFAGKLCASVMVPASDHVFAAGKVAASIEVNLGYYHYAEKHDALRSPFSQPAPPVVVPKGRYKVIVHGAGVVAEANLVVN